MTEVFLQLAKSKIKVLTDDLRYIKRLEKYFTFVVDGAFFSPLYKSGRWDGKKHLMTNDKFPFGLFFDFLRFHKKYYNDVKLQIDNDIKEIFKNKENIDYNYDLKFKPRNYQQTCIENAIKYKNNLFVSPTASGKSLILAYIWKTLYENKKIERCILVVPTINLITQFKDDLIDYGIDKNLIGEVFTEKKEWDKTFVISTWQTLSNNIKRLSNFDMILLDEIHQGKTTSIQKILKGSFHMKYKIGCTGTLPNNKLDNFLVKSYLGPISSYFKVSDLVKLGFINECIVKVYKIKYKQEITGNYNEVKDNVFQNSFRLNVIRNIISSIEKNDNILILVNKIEKEGKLLEDFINNCIEFKHYKVKFIHGKMKAKEREKWRQKAIKDKNIILIAVYALFQQGINIPTLKHIILSSSNKSKIRTLQSIGRSLRKSEGKGKSIIYDIVDYSNKYLPKHGNQRIKFYKKEEFDYEIINIKEK